SSTSPSSPSGRTITCRTICSRRCRTTGSRNCTKRCWSTRNIKTRRCSFTATSCRRNVRKCIRRCWTCSARSTRRANITAYISTIRCWKTTRWKRRTRLCRKVNWKRAAWRNRRLKNNGRLRLSSARLLSRKRPSVRPPLFRFGFLFVLLQRALQMPFEVLDIVHRIDGDIVQEHHAAHHTDHAHHLVRLAGGVLEHLIVGVNLLDGRCIELHFQRRHLGDEVLDVRLHNRLITGWHLIFQHGIASFGLHNSTLLYSTDARRNIRICPGYQTPTTGRSPLWPK